MRERVSLRKKPCPPALFQLRRVNISELNRKVGQIQIQFFRKANGSSFQFFPPMVVFIILKIKSARMAIALMKTSEATYRKDRHLRRL
ncbi:MAG: hypothetical protein A2445_00700 [Candidatus Jacksonbacteria bacterium RIFOXYC2_FULL_44_29]|nr:MAG: hypothetical protein A2295_03915 [Candidatus Jacksonbacteria bacterium RIFOXYB2_FULL_44_15]OGY76377.1 MAG: hypothetical protein A2240_04430 [Candidatus Jacksonbacteria bacterium RIFOXYA2_FULL_43_12]OGY78015.1 MAG: hypothetical protein A2445_00700 [Candidatus Jacksonbacteria bacterium RIFOXYC2_FULL_44_29]OGY80313.1 MAG: hypothetical protein A2550_04385 [Candidatus Jacksonbacteria bacterium RIFOXYD2_FULL_43_21]HCC50090.1 hypothetical protein [Candidatus Jacksonbacteria bacterium]